MTATKCDRCIKIAWLRLFRTKESHEVRSNRVRYKIRLKDSSESFEINLIPMKGWVNKIIYYLHHYTTIKFIFKPAPIPKKKKYVERIRRCTCVKHVVKHEQVKLETMLYIMSILSVCIRLSNRTFHTF